MRAIASSVSSSKKAVDHGRPPIHVAWRNRRADRARRRAQMSDDLSGEYAIIKYRHIEAVRLRSDNHAWPTDRRVRPSNHRGPRMARDLGPGAVPRTSLDRSEGRVRRRAQDAP